MLCQTFDTALSFWLSPIALQIRAKPELSRNEFLEVKRLSCSERAGKA